MDFFNSKPTTTNPSDGLVTPGFKQALNERFSANGTSSLLTSAFTPAMPLQTPLVPSSGTARALYRSAVPRLPLVPQGAIAGPSTIVMPSHKQNNTTAAITTFTALLPEQVVSLTNLQDVLVIDIRPPAQYQISRFPGAISLVVPSTLLKRPGFSLEKMAGMIEDEPSQSRFKKWVSVKKLVVYDVDTSFLVDGTNLASLLRKFQAYGYEGELAWIKGGFNALLRSCPSVIDTSVQTTRLEDQVTESKDTFLRARNLSTHAFQQSSTTLVGQRTPKGSDHIRTASSASVAANPFYDNIRQNIELSQGVDTRIPLLLPQEIIARKNDLPFKWLRDVVDNNIKDETGELLAMQFYRIELGEQRRLQGVMEHHSTESGHKSDSGPSAGVDGYPYSITAGIEMGTKNRYRNIWPFEHARVRLPTSCGGSDYFNASFVQSLVSSRRYIATQGPLDSTYDDFWA
jgi:tyrosine-protein phosphatase 2/3